MEQFTITELAYAIIAISGAISGVLMVIWKSRCSKIECGYGCISCDREPLPPQPFRGVQRPQAELGRPQAELEGLEMETFNDANSI